MKKRYLIPKNIILIFYLLYIMTFFLLFYKKKIFISNDSIKKFLNIIFYLIFSMENNFIYNLYPKKKY